MQKEHDIKLIKKCKVNLFFLNYFFNFIFHSLLQSEVSWSGPDVSTFYNIPPEPTLYVYESIELELSLTTVAIESDEVITDDFSCPIRLHSGNLSGLILKGPNSPTFFLQFNSDCQDRRKSVRNEFFKVWPACIPFQHRKLCQAVNGCMIMGVLTNSYRWSICHAKQWGL